MGDDRDRDDAWIPYRWIYAGLVFGIVVQILVGWFAIDRGGVPPIGNTTTAIVCAGAIFLIRARQKGRL